MKPTYQSILKELILCDLDEPPYDLQVHDWLRSHGLIESRLLDPTYDPNDARSYCIALTVTGRNLLNLTSIYFQQMLRGLHETGQLKPKEPNGTQDNNDPDEQGHDGSKGKGSKKTKDHVSRYGRR